MEKKFVGFYNYTVILTYIGMLSGFIGITLAIDGNLKWALFCLILSGFCDLWDGLIASTMKRTDDEKNFGIEIDSFSDMVCFGVLPGVITYTLNRGKVYAIAIAGLFTLCALIRLAYFNVEEVKRQGKEKVARKYFHGMPTTAVVYVYPAAIIIAGMFHFYQPIVALIATAFCGFMYISPFRIRKPGTVGKILFCIYYAVLFVGTVMFG